MYHAANTTPHDDITTSHNLRSRIHIPDDHHMARVADHMAGAQRSMYKNCLAASQIRLNWFEFQILLEVGAGNFQGQAEIGACNTGLFRGGQYRS